MEIFWKNPVFPNLQKFCKKKFGNKFGSKTPVFGSKKPVLKQKQGYWGQKRGFRIFQIYGLFGICSVQIFQKLQKNYVKIEFLFSRKTRSDLNIRVRVRYAGP